MCAGMFMAILDIQIVASSLPEIQHALDIRKDDLSWIQTGYLISEVVAIALTGWLTRLLSLRGLFVGATFGFAAASLGCALSAGFASLVTMRVLQGFFGGALIPAVFTSVFVLFPERRRILATTLAGVFAMIAPTIGPAVGGYLTETYTWHAIFLVNLLPALAVAIVVALAVRASKPDWSEWARLDYGTLIFAVLFLASLEILMKEGPPRGWSGDVVGALLFLCPISGIAVVGLCLARDRPLLDMRAFADRAFSVGCILSFVLGIGLYGSVYLLPLFLGFVRGHSPLEIGTIMMVTGATQLFVSPFAALAETRVRPRILAAVGFGLFAAGLVSNGFETYQSDFDELFWPQAMRGAAVMLCLLPATRLALDGWSEKRLADASALFNLMRNLGGAIGIALIDSVVEQSAPRHAAALFDRLQAGDADAARVVGLPLDRFGQGPLGPIDELTKAMIEPLVERASLVLAFNEAWILTGVVLAAALLVLSGVRVETRRSGD